MPRKINTNSSNRSQTKPSKTPVKLKPMRTLEQKTRFSERRRAANPIVSLLLYASKVAILGVGIGAIAGTVLSLVNPTALVRSQKTVTPTDISSAGTSSGTVSSSKPTSEVQPSPIQKQAYLTLKQEIAPLKQKLTAIAGKYPKLQPAAFFIDLDNGAYVNLQGDTVFSAASTIKIPILVAFFEDVDRGKIHLDETLTMTKDVVAGGSGDMQYQPVNKKYTALETVTKMIIISDNTATNMLIKRMGGKEVLTQRFKSWGMEHTVINNILPDLEGTNPTSPKDLVMILAKVNQGELISLKSRDRLLGIMRETRTNTLLPPGLEKNAIIAHKTGDIGTVIGDAGIVDMPSGKRYLAVVMVKRPKNDIGGRMLIQEMSRTSYQHLKWYTTRPTLPKPAIETKKPEETNQ